MDFNAHEEHGMMTMCLESGIVSGSENIFAPLMDSVI